MTLALYWPGLVCWFQKDDFVWLKLLSIARESQGFFWALFHPLAQGTIRPLSERVFFMAFSALFGVNPLPYRAWAFLTFIAGLFLLASLCFHLTGSRTAGFWAAILWLANSSLGYALSWTAIYYELLCAVSLMLSLWLLVRYAETGARRYYIWQWISFLLGFGILELNVVYPALAAAYAFCCARRLLKKVWPMFLVSALYSGIHTWLAPLSKQGPYKMFWDASIFSTLWTYWKWALGPSRLIYLRVYPSPFRSFLTVLLMAGLLGFLARKVFKREWLTAFFASWFLIVMAPLLPLRDHMDAYYLTIPLIGLSLWGGWAVVCGWKSGWLGRTAVIGLLAIYLGVSMPLAPVVAKSFDDRSQQIRSFVLGVTAATKGRTDPVVLLRGVDSELFWSAVYHGPFPLFGLKEVYLLADERDKIVPEIPATEKTQFYADQSMIHDAFRAGRAVVLDVSDGHVRDVTGSYKEALGL